MAIYKPPRVHRTPYGTPLVTPMDTSTFKHLVGINVNDILLFNDGTDEYLEQGRTILPRHYFIFVGNKDGEMQFKPYEPNQYRIVVNTYHDIITMIESIG